MLPDASSSRVNDTLVTPVLPPASVIMSDAGGSTGVTSVSFTLDDDASGSIPTPIVNGGIYKATNVGVGDDGFPAPAPTPVTGSAALSNFVGTNPNGTWSLYV